MKKSSVILLMVLLTTLLFIFQNIHAMFGNYEEVGVRDPVVLMESLKKLAGVFSSLSVICGLLLVAAGLYLVYLFRKPKDKPDFQGIPPLQDYLLELRSSQTQLKDMVETQQVTVTQKEELNKNIINNINAAIIFLNPAGRVEIFNAPAEKMFNQSYANAVNNTLDKALARFPEIVVFADKHETERVSGEIVSADGIFWVHLNPLDQIGVLLIIQDITEERQREEIDRRNSNFIMLGEMTAFLAHEVRNSMGVIFGYTKTIKSEQAKTEKINREIHFLTEMMDSFLNFSKPVTVDKKEAVDPAAMLQKIAGETGVAVEIGGETADIENDPALMHAVFSNLLLNAEEAGADRVTVTFSKDKNLEILLTDNGGGIDEKHREKIWYPFFTTKDKGTGMGLASIRKIINSLNGEILLQGSSEKGTTFKIVFYT